MENKTDFLIENGVLTKYQGPGGHVVIPEGVTEIGERSFASCAALTGVTLPEGLLSIGPEGFFGCRALTGVTLPRSLTHLGEGAFSGCHALTAVELPAGMTGVAEYAFSNCRGLTDLILPEGMVRIGRSAFAGCWRLKEVTLPHSLTEIDEFAFHDCGLTDLPAAPGLKRLERSAFSKCQSLTRVTLYEGLDRLERGVFFGCTRLTDVTLPKGLAAVSKGAFLECDSLVRIHAHPENPHFRDIDGMLYSRDGERLLICPNGLSQVTVPVGVREIGPEAFADGAPLERVALPESLRLIGERAFGKCAKLTRLDLPAGLEELGQTVFEGCKGLTTLVLPHKVRRVGAGAFQKCGQLQWISAPEGLPFDLHWFVNPHDPECRSADHTTVPFVTTREIGDIISRLGKRYAGLGFILADIAGVETGAAIREGYMDYIRENLELFHQELLTDVEILQWMTDHRMIRKEDVEGLLEKAAAGGHTAASAALLDYHNRVFSPKDQAKLMDLRFEQFEDALSL